MKRYWKITVTLLIIIVTLGIFYSQTTSAIKNIDLRINKISGDETVLEDVKIRGSVEEMGSYIWEDFTFENNQIDFYSENSISKRFKVTSDKTFERLYNDHKNFLRGKITGKSEDPTMFYEDDKQLIYAEIISDRRILTGDTSNYRFFIDVLDKETNKSNSFKLPVPDQKDTNYMDVVDVQLVNDELVVTALRSGDFSEVWTHENYEENHVLTDTYHVYRFDINKQELLSKEEIDIPFDSSAENIEEIDFINLFMVSKENSLQSNPYHVIAVKFYEENIISVEYGSDGSHSESYENKLVDQQLFVYHLETGVLNKLELPEDILLNATFYKIDHHKLYLSIANEDQLEVMVIDIETNEIEGTVTIGQANNFYGEFIEVADNKLYILSGDMEASSTASIMVLDLITEEILYEGEIEVLKNDEKAFNIHFGSIEVYK